MSYDIFNESVMVPGAAPCILMPHDMESVSNWVYREYLADVGPEQRQVLWTILAVIAEVRDKWDLEEWLAEMGNGETCECGGLCRLCVATANVARRAGAPR